MSWKRVIVASGTGGGIKPGDLSEENLANSTADEGKVLKIKADGTSLGWYADETIAHPTGFAESVVAIDTTAPASGNSLADGGGNVISELLVDIQTDADGHTTAASGSVKTREMTLADLGYVGAHDANNFVHPEQGPATATQNLNITALSANEVITGLAYSRTTDSWGHTTAHSSGFTTKALDLSDLGYSGAADADNYHYWTAQADGGSAENITSDGIVNFKAGPHISIENEVVAGTLNIKISGDPVALGTITTLTEGNGVTFTSQAGVAVNSFDGTTPSGTVSLETPQTVTVGGTNSPGDSAASEGHSHALESVYDAHADQGKLIHANSDGYIKVTTLEVANSFTVNGAEVILGSANLQIEDNSVQINYNSGDSDYNDLSSALIFGLDYDAVNGRARSGKIVNHVDVDNGVNSGFVFTDLTGTSDDDTNGDVGNGSVGIDGNAKPLYTGPVIASGSVFCQNVYSNGYVWSGGSLLTDNYIQFIDQSETPVGESGSAEDGMVYWSGDDMWVYYA